MNNEYLKQRLNKLGYEVIYHFNMWFIFKGTTKIIDGKNLTHIYEIITKRTTK